MFEKVLVANRGEIAVRVIRALEELGIASVAVYSEIDRDALHVAARRRGLPAGRADGGRELPQRGQDPRGDARSPGRRRCTRATASWPRTRRSRAPARRRGSSSSARPPARSTRWAPRPAPASSCRRPGCRSCRARPSRSPTVDAARKLIDAEIGYPVAIKAAGGGGGKGFRVALTEDELEKAFEGAAREGEKFFSDATVYIERYLPDPRHVEVQVLADGHGNVIHLGERDCSIQRRHQKLIEEAPGPLVDEALREQIGKVATDAARAVDYKRRGHDRGPAAGRRVLLPGDEHARAGRALRDRDGHRDRHRQGGHPRGGRRAAERGPGGRGAARPRDRVPHQRRGREQELRAGAGQDRRLQGALRSGRARRLRRRGGRRGLADVRPDGGQADRLGRRSRAGDAGGCCAR